MKCLNWNLEWQKPLSRAAKLILERIAAIDPDVACYTEVLRDLVPEGHAIESEADYGYPLQPGRRKVMLWSRQPWTDVDSHGHEGLPQGRFVSGIACGIRFVGVCIPWPDAHVRSGRRDRARWEDHIAYCEVLGPILQRYVGSGVPVCMLGDYNQRIPRVSQPPEAAKALSDAIPDSFHIATAGLIDREGKRLVDHYAATPGLEISIEEVLSKSSADGTQLSDHPGVVARIEVRG